MASHSHPAAMCQKLKQLHIPLSSVNSCRHGTAPSMGVGPESSTEGLAEIHTLTIPQPLRARDHSGCLWPALEIPDLPPLCIFSRKHLFSEILQSRHHLTKKFAEILLQSPGVGVIS